MMLNEDLHHICILNLFYIIHLIQRVVGNCFKISNSLDHILFSFFDYSDIISNVLNNEKLTIINLYVFLNSVSAFLSYLTPGILN